jgi:hypothetical protein
VAAALATPAGRKGQAPVTQAMVDGLTAQVHALEAVSGLLSDWSGTGPRPGGGVLRSGADGVPAGGAVCGAAGRGGRSWC